MTQHRRIAAVIVLALVAAGCSSSSRPSPSSSSRPPTSRSTVGASTAELRLRWHSCSTGECATLTIPLDTTRDAGPTIKLAVGRASRAKSGRKIGSLLVNPGGPGAPGLDIVEYIAAQLPRAITDRFDVVAWDPRGTGGSSPVDCVDDLDEFIAVDRSPDEPAEVDENLKAARAFAWIDRIA